MAAGRWTSSTSAKSHSPILSRTLLSDMKTEVRRSGVRLASEFSHAGLTLSLRKGRGGGGETYLPKPGGLSRVESEYPGQKSTVPRDNRIYHPTFAWISNFHNCKRMPRVKKFTFLETISLSRRKINKYPILALIVNPLSVSFTEKVF